MEIDQPTSTVTSGSNSDSGSPITSPATPVKGSIETLTFPRKRPLRQDDPFFQEGRYEYKAAWLRLEDEHAYVPAMIEAEDGARYDIGPRTRLTPAQACHTGRCHGERTFPNAATYEHHYETNHRHICETCRKSFPGEKWLELHLREVHDTLIRIRRERGEKTYQCFVEGCDRVCSRPKKRERHLIDKHQYPKRFNFNIVLTGIVPFTERMKQAQREKALWLSREQGRHRVNKDISQTHQSQHRHQLPSQDCIEDSGAMEVESSSISSVIPSHKTNANPRETSSSGPGSRTSGSSGFPPKKNAFRQYRTPEAKPVSRKKPPITADHIMETDPAPAPVRSSGGEAKVDMDIDQLQQGMARLMIPRSVANRMRQRITSSSSDGK